MDPRPPLTKDEKLALARRAFREFSLECFWSADPNTRIEEAHIPVVVRGLRRHGGHAGYRIAAELCR